jgi:hypothetical protein
MEMMTAVNYAMALNVVVINNATMGLIRKNQFQLYGERYIDCDFVNPDFAPAGAIVRHSPHHRIETEADLDALFAEGRPDRRQSTSSKSCSTRMPSPATCRHADLAAERRDRRPAAGHRAFRGRPVGRRLRRQTCWPVPGGLARWKN